ncbi:hypothetical protein [Vulcanisaeta sp. JCM 16159]|uniref:hypothetical protein n=1 Tax=Vulcanisaeta sp. JCM 16159 TaxID=1295371 RepID=UPI0006D00214|nr:hypothetical protein [Vulcanisaeta sp. JCM 16159]
MDVVDALINNPSSGIELHRAKYSDEVTAIQERTLKLLGVGPNEDFTTSPRYPIQWLGRSRMVGSRFT